MKSGNLNFLEPSGPLQACNGTDLSLRVPVTIIFVLEISYYFRQNVYNVCLSVVGYSILKYSSLRERCAVTYACKGEGKTVPLQDWSGPEGSRKLRFPDFMTTAQEVGKVVSLTHRPHLPPGNPPGTHFC